MTFGSGGRRSIQLSYARSTNALRSESYRTPGDGSTRPTTIAPRRQFGPWITLLRAAQDIESLQNYARGVRAHRTSGRSADRKARSLVRRSGLSPYMVGATGFEPATSCSRSRRSTGLSYAPPNWRFIASYDDAPGRTRTSNLLIRSQMLYPIELRAPTSRSDAEAAHGCATTH